MRVLRYSGVLALGISVLACLLYLLVVANFTQRLEDPEVYRVAISDTGAYGRIYDEVLADEALQGQTGRLLGDIDLAAHGGAAEVLRDIMPPAYLQEQTEDNIDRFTGFLRHESEDLEIYVSLKEPLERIEPVALGEVHQVIDELEIAEPGSSGCSPTALRRLAAASAEPLARLSAGELPDSAPSLNLLTRECRERELGPWLDLVLDDPLIDSHAALIIGNEREELRRTFIEGDTRGFLKAVADPLVKPVIEDAGAGIRRNLQADDRFDLLEWLANQSEDLSRQDIEEQAESLRQALGVANGPGRLVALALAVLGILLLALLHLPRPAAMLRWPGITLAMGGGICLIVGFTLNAFVPGTLKDAIVQSASYPSNVPASAVNLAGDLLESFGRQATAGFIPAVVMVIALGVVLIAASLFYGKLSSAVR